MARPFSKVMMFFRERCRITPLASVNHSGQSSVVRVFVVSYFMRC